MNALQYGDSARQQAEKAAELNTCWRYLLVDILRPEAQCTNGSSERERARGNSFFAPCLAGNFALADIEKTKGWTIFEVLPPAFDGCPLRFKVRGETRQTMAGGNFAYTSDSRFSETYGAPISIHDRTEA